jgi:serine/threonine protein phosphatase PrpC
VQVVASEPDLGEAARLLCREAIDARCGDNTTVVIARLQPE